MTKLRLGIPDLLDARPLAWGFLRGHHGDLFEPRPVPGERMAGLLRERALDVALVESDRLPELEATLLVPDLCVAAAGSSDVALLQSSVPFEAVEQVAVDVNCGSAAGLLRVLWQRRYGRQPRIVPMRSDDGVPPSCDARLLRSEGVLTASWQAPHLMRPTSWWHEDTGLPFVFDVWVVRDGVELPDLPFYFKSSLRYGLASLDALCREAAPPMAGRAQRLRRYLEEQITWVLGSEERRGLERFLEALGEPGGESSVPRAWSDRRRPVL